MIFFTSALAINSLEASEEIFVENLSNSSSISITRSSIFSAAHRAEAAALRVEATFMEQAEQADREQQRLSAKRRRLELDIKIAKADAVAKVYEGNDLTSIASLPQRDRTHSAIQQRKDTDDAALSEEAHNIPSNKSVCHKPSHLMSIANNTPRADCTSERPSPKEKLLYEEPYLASLKAQAKSLRMSRDDKIRTETERAKKEIDKEISRIDSEIAKAEPTQYAYHREIVGSQHCNQRTVHQSNDSLM